MKSLRFITHIFNRNPANQNGLVKSALIKGAKISDADHRIELNAVKNVALKCNDSFMDLTLREETFIKSHKVREALGIDASAREVQAALNGGYGFGDGKDRSGERMYNFFGRCSLSQTCSGSNEDQEKALQMVLLAVEVLTDDKYAAQLDYRPKAPQKWRSLEQVCEGLIRQVLNKYPELREQVESCYGDLNRMDGSTQESPSPEEGRRPVVSNPNPNPNQDVNYAEINQFERYRRTGSGKIVRRDDTVPSPDGTVIANSHVEYAEVRRNSGQQDPELDPIYTEVVMRSDQGDSSADNHEAGSVSEPPFGVRQKAGPSRVIRQSPPPPPVEDELNKRFRELGLKQDDL